MNELKSFIDFFIEIKIVKCMLAILLKKEIANKLNESRQMKQIKIIYTTKVTLG